MGEYTNNFLGKDLIQILILDFLGRISYKHISMGFYGGRYQELFWEGSHTNIFLWDFTVDGTKNFFGKCFIQNICIILLGTLVCVFLLGVPCSGA